MKEDFDKNAIKVKDITKKYDEFTPFDEYPSAMNMGRASFIEERDAFTVESIPKNIDRNNDMFDLMIAESEGNLSSAMFTQDARDRLAKSTQDAEQVEGILEVFSDGFGFLHFKEPVRGNDKIYVSPKVVKYFDLRNGDKVFGVAVPQTKTSTLVLIMANKVDGVIISPKRKRPHFDTLLPIFPFEKFNLCDNETNDIALRLIDLLTPLAMGQRALIVAPPKSGKTTLLKNIVKAIKANHSNSKVLVLLSDQRPEDITDINRSLDAEVYACTYDDTVDMHIKTAKQVLNRCTRLVEGGFDAVLVVDNMSSFARSYNFVAPPSGKTIFGWFDPIVFNDLKRYFGTARKTEGAGSLTMIATLAESDDEIDVKIYNELKSFANLELHLMAPSLDCSYFPTINWHKSFSFKKELFINDKEMECNKIIRQNLLIDDSYVEYLIDKIKSTSDVSEIIESILAEKIIDSKLH